MRVWTLAALAGALAVSACDELRPPPPDPEAAEQCMRNRNWACAEENFHNYLRLYPNDSRRNALMAITLTREGKHREALPYYQRAETAGLGTYDLFANYAVSLDAAGQTEQAMAYNRRALALVPQLVDVRGHLAEQLVRLGRRQEAIDLLQTFDDDLIARGRAPYFTGQIMTIRGQMGAPATPPSSPP